MYTQKNLLCIHKRSLVHAQHSCACSGPGTQQKALGRSQALHRAFVYTQEILSCTRNKCILTLSYFLIILIIIYPLVQDISLTAYIPSVVLTYILSLHILHPLFSHIFLLHRMIRTYSMIQPTRSASYRPVEARLS